MRKSVSVILGSQLRGEAGDRARKFIIEYCGGYVMEYDRFMKDGSNGKLLKLLKQLQ